LGYFFAILSLRMDSECSYFVLKPFQFGLLFSRFEPQNGLGMFLFCSKTFQIWAIFSRFWATEWTRNVLIFVLNLSNLGYFFSRFEPKNGLECSYFFLKPFKFSVWKAGTNYKQQQKLKTDKMLFGGCHPSTPVSTLPPSAGGLIVCDVTLNSFHIKEYKKASQYIYILT